MKTYHFSCRDLHCKYLALGPFLTVTKLEISLGTVIYGAQPLSNLECSPKNQDYLGTAINGAQVIFRLGTVSNGAQTNLKFGSR